MVAPESEMTANIVTNQVLTSESGRGVNIHAAAVNEVSIHAVAVNVRIGARYVHPVPRQWAHLVGLHSKVSSHAKRQRPGSPSQQRLSHRGTILTRARILTLAVVLMAQSSRRNHDQSCLGCAPDG